MATREPGPSPAPNSEPTLEPSPAPPAPSPAPSAPIRLQPSLQRYAWGDPGFLPAVLGLTSDGGPWAEAWFGDHPRGPARVGGAGSDEGDEGARGLDQLVREHAEAILGPAVRTRFGGLPYLLKILSAAQPLSIQVHPNQAQAEAGWAREEDAALAVDAPTRSYRDHSHKPELLVALSEFYALCGFRPPAEIARALSELPELSALLPAYRPDHDEQPGPDGPRGLPGQPRGLREQPRALRGQPRALRGLIEAYLDLPDQRLDPALARLVDRLSEQDARAPFGPDQPAYWALRAHRGLPGPGPDRGLLWVFLLALARLAPGQGIFLPAGVPHAYLQGAGVEIMACSDNVLRAGLTPKHVDATELCAVLRWDAGPPPVLTAEVDQAGREGTYATAAREFELCRIELDAGPSPERVTAGPETVLVLPAEAADDAATTAATKPEPDPERAAVTLVYDRGPLALAPGQACLVPYGVRYRLEADRPARVFRAAVPDPDLDAGDFRGRRPAALAFGTSGLRGLVDDITDLEAYVNTRGFLDHLVNLGEAVPGTPVALAGDLRPSTDGPARSIVRAVAQAVRDSGMRVRYCGRVPTPALTYYGLRHGWPSIMVTGSHIPFDRNGIKFNRPGGEVLKTDEAPILAAVARVRRREYARARTGSRFDDGGWFASGRADPVPPAIDDARALYLRRYLDAFPAGALAGLRVALYEHSAVGRELVAEILRGLGAEVHPVGRSTEFVPIDTEAISDARLNELQAMTDRVVAEVGPIDAVVSTDGDSDRPLVLAVDDAGRVRFVPGDVLGAVVAEYLGTDGACVPVSANDLIDHYLGPRGVEVVRTRIGSPWVIAAMSRLSGARRVGWEANGGFLTASTIPLAGGPLPPLPTRDAALPIVAALHAARRAGRSLLDLVAALPARFGSSGLLDQVPPAASRALLDRFGPGDPAVRTVRFDSDDVRCIDHDGHEAPAEPAAAARLAQIRRELGACFGPARGFGQIAEIDYLDGVRVRFAGGDVAHVRPSGNAPQLRIYALADSEARAAEIVAMALAEPDGLLRDLLAAAAS
ncbi:mannose-6-phosphate isomerase, class I [Haliangium sp.]|uniref:mannose-6-phosphate isomerase, class I n=1 Tax=Haliangium sp. TaxID=2663208 RepID=UPI003D0E38AA